jgi:hypothetical protein
VTVRPSGVGDIDDFHEDPVLVEMEPQIKIHAGSLRRWRRM